MSLSIRKVKFNELDRVMEVYAVAKRFMEEHNNLNQWTGDDAVTREKLELLVSREQLFMGEEAGEIRFVFAYILGEDPTYSVITEGSWVNNEAYGTIHRLASAGHCKGVVQTVTDWALSRCRNLRIDTHHDNSVMQNALNKAGFTRCGIIFLENDDPRIAYQKVAAQN